MMPMTQQNKPYFCLQHYQDPRSELIICLYPSPLQTATNSANINERLFSRAHGLQHITLMKSSSPHPCSCMCYEACVTYKPQWETQSICVSNQSCRNLPIEEAWKQSGLEELQKNFSNIITWHYCLFFKLENPMKLDTHHDICCFHLPNEVKHQAHSSTKCTWFAHV